MSEKTPGQRAYEAAPRGSLRTAPHWVDLYDCERSDWERIGRAAAPGSGLAPEPDLPGLTAQLAAAEAYAAECQGLVAEILDHFGPSGSGHTARVGQVQIARWRERAGLEEK